MGFIVVMIKAEANDDESLLEAFKGMRHDLVVLSRIVVSGYAAFLPYSFAMYQIFTEEIYIFSLLAFFSVVAFVAYAHNQAESLRGAGE